jgi:hypothetical protein
MTRKRLRIETPISQLIKAGLSTVVGEAAR